MEGGGHATPAGMTAAAPAATATANEHERRPSERDQVAGTSPNEPKRARTSTNAHERRPDECDQVAGTNRNKHTTERAQTSGNEDEQRQ
jgi:hypothetical protein